MSEDKFDGIRESGQPAPLYFNVLFYGLIIWAVIFMAYYLFSGWSSHQEFQEKMQSYRQEHHLAFPGDQQ